MHKVHSSEVYSLTKAIFLGVGLAPVHGVPGLEEPVLCNLEILNNFFTKRLLIFILLWVFQVLSVRSVNYYICLLPCNHLLDQAKVSFRLQKCPPAPSQSAPPSGDCQPNLLTVQLLPDE